HGIARGGDGDAALGKTLTRVALRPKLEANGFGDRIAGYIRRVDLDSQSAAARRLVDDLYDVGSRLTDEWRRHEVHPEVRTEQREADHEQRGRLPPAVSREEVPLQGGHKGHHGDGARDDDH